MKVIYGECTQEELKVLNDKIHENFEKEIDSGKAIIDINDILNGTILKHQFMDGVFIVLDNIKRKEE